MSLLATTKRTPNDNDVQEAVQRTIDLIAAEAGNDIILRAGWESLVAWSLLNPGRASIDRLVDGWDNLTPDQQQQIQALYRIPAWGDLSHWQQEAYRQGFDRQIGYILRLVQTKISNEQEQE